MAEGDNPARFTNTGTIDETLTGVKANPITKNRLPEDGGVGGRTWQYTQTGHKDLLPEHQARRDAYPFINAR